jgi:hypothetical protein
MREMRSRRRGRLILFWFTVALIVVVAVVAVVTILRLFRGIPADRPPLDLQPADTILCPGQGRTFTTDSDQVAWSSTGGPIGLDGHYVAGDVPGDYLVSAVDEETGQTGQVAVHILECTPTAQPQATATPAPTDLPPAEATTVPPQPVVPVDDPQGDVGAYNTGEEADGVPGGVDIRTGSIGGDLRVALQPDYSGVPEELAGWQGVGDALLWIVLYEPIPEAPTAYTDWLFALDLDGNPQTGRPPGQARINPGLGDDAAIGLSYDPASGTFVPYFLAWNPQDDGWATGPDQVRHFISGDRTLIAFALPLQTLADVVAQTTGVTVVEDSVKGRSAVLSYVGEQAVIDLYPDAPD